MWPRYIDSPPPQIYHIKYIGSRWVAPTHSVIYWPRLTFYFSWPLPLGCQLARELARGTGERMGFNLNQVTRLKLRIFSTAIVVPSLFGLAHPHLYLLRHDVLSFHQGLCSSTGCRGSLD